MCLEWKAALGKRSLKRLDKYFQTNNSYSGTDHRIHTIKETTATEKTQLCRAKVANWLIMIS